MKCRIVSGCEADDYPHAGITIELTHDRTLFKEVTGVSMHVELKDNQGDPEGVVLCQMSFTEAIYLAERLAKFCREHSPY